MNDYCKKLKILMRNDLKSKFDNKYDIIDIG